jgi:hypothetical protein
MFILLYNYSIILNILQGHCRQPNLGMSFPLFQRLPDGAIIEVLNTELSIPGLHEDIKKVLKIQVSPTVRRTTKEINIIY